MTDKTRNAVERISYLFLGLMLGVLLTFLCEAFLIGKLPLIDARNATISVNTYYLNESFIMPPQPESWINAANNAERDHDTVCYRKDDMDRFLGKLYR